MPNPIPDWDLARRLVKYVGMKQIIGELVTIRDTSRTLGIGRKRIESLLEGKKIIYKVISEEKSSGKDLLFLEYVPNTLALDAGIANSELDKSYKKFLDRRQQGEIKISPYHRTRLNKKQRESMKIKEFWGNKEISP